MSFVVPWTQGDKVDLEKLAAVPADHWSNAQTWVMKMDPSLDPESTPDSRRDRGIAWYPKGSIDIAEAPRKMDETGQVTVKLSNGAFHFEKSFAVRICIPFE